MSITTKYDYIFLGAGCSGLSLLVRMLESGKFHGKKILLVDKEEKKHNDRTWCFWEKSAGYFENIVYRKWDQFYFASDDFNATLPISPYKYKLIRAQDFYQHCFHIINQQSNVEILYRHIDPEIVWKDYPNRILNLDGLEVDAVNAIVFNSIYPGKPDTDKSLLVLQHFKGWVIETSPPEFRPDRPILMDFRVHQRYGTSFAYVLPFAENRALVEYTLFTKSLLETSIYEQELKNYIQQALGITDYRVIEQEFGVIPMTNRKFDLFHSGMVHIGAAGGQTKASSGYTFQFIQKQSDQLLNRLVSGNSIDSLPASPSRFRFYDQTLLKILYYNSFPGKKIFTALFKKNPPQRVLKFLDNESSIKEELQIISSLPAWPFIKSIW